MYKFQINITDNIADWPPLALLSGIYFGYFNREKISINSNIDLDYEENIEKITSSFIKNTQSLSTIERLDDKADAFTMYGLGKEAESRCESRHRFINILNVFYLIAFSIFGLRIFFTTINLFPKLLPYMYLTGIALTILIILATCIVKKH